MARYGYDNTWREKGYALETTCKIPNCKLCESFNLLKEYDSTMARYSTMKEGAVDRARALGPEIGEWKPVGPNQGILEESVKLFLRGIGEDPERDGLKDTPKRVAKAYMQCLSGYWENPEDQFTQFDNDENYSGPVILKGAELYSFCEHHFFVFNGVVDIAYQPRDKIVGLSKLVRVARVFAKRLQVQERLTKQIADCLQDLLDPEWVVVRYTAEHFCMRIRGTRIKDSTTTTIAHHGNYPRDIFSH